VPLAFRSWITTPPVGEERTSMADAPRFTVDVLEDVVRPGSYRWIVSGNMKVRDKSLYSFRTKRQAQVDADKFVQGLDDIWQTDR
jgi:hypothetical protein